MPKEEQKNLYVQYVNHAYEIFDRLRAKYPKVEIESCSGGGGRVDLGILKRVDEVWTSDNTEAFDRLRIQEGFSYAYAPKVMMDWVTDVPNMNGRSTPLKYRFLVAMQGSLGIGSNLNHWKAEDFELATKMVSTYKKIRGTVQQGKLYRLSSPREGDLTANQYVSEDERQAVLFASRQAQQFNRLLPAIYLKGLDSAAKYKIQTLDDKLAETQNEVSGSFLMNHGLNLNLGGDFDSTLIVMEKVD
jgi:alpha-galactosidase